MHKRSAHSAGALYQAFEPAEARRILGKLEFHFTPKRPSWLTMVEIEIGVMVDAHPRDRGMGRCSPGHMQNQPLGGAHTRVSFRRAV